GHRSAEAVLVVARPGDDERPRSEQLARAEAVFVSARCHQCHCNQCTVTETQFSSSGAAPSSPRFGPHFRYIVSPIRLPTPATSSANPRTFDSSGSVVRSKFSLYWLAAALASSRTLACESSSRRG